MKDLKMKFPLDIQLFAESTESTEQTETVETEETTEPTVSKKVLDKALSDLAQAKKDLKAKMTDEETQALALVEKENELEQLRNENKKSKMVASLAKNGIDEKSIAKIADLAISGDTDNLAIAINEAMTAKNTELQKELDKLQLEATKRPAEGDNGAKEITKGDFQKMSLDERTSLKNENPELYNSLRG